MYKNVHVKRLTRIKRNATNTTITPANSVHQCNNIRETNGLLLFFIFPIKKKKKKSDIFRSFEVVDYAVTCMNIVMVLWRWRRMSLYNT